MGVGTDQVAAIRMLASDEQGVGLRATWRPRFGFVNLSLWRDRRCVETFHLSPVDAARLVSFLAESLASVAPEPDRLPLRTVPIDAQVPYTGASRSRLDEVVSDARRRGAVALEELARRLRT